MTDLDTAARRIHDAFEQDLAGYHAPAGLAERAMAGGRTRARRRWRLPAAAGLTAATAAAALTATTLLPGATGTPSALAAWTVTHRGGVVVVLIREFRDPAGLQRKLRAEGVPASVSISISGKPPHCRWLEPGLREFNRVFPFVHPGRGPDMVLIRPAAIVPGTGVALVGQQPDPGYGHAVVALPEPTGAPAGPKFQKYRAIPIGHWPHRIGLVGFSIVRASPECTGT